MTQLSWQPPTPPTVTKCSNCPHTLYLGDNRYRCKKVGHVLGFGLWKENKDGLTKTCPMWIGQNKETPNANT